MTKKSVIYRCIFIVVMGLLSIDSLYSQKTNEKKINDLIEKAVPKIYSNPNEVIRTGNKIIREPAISVDIKIRAYTLLSDGYSSKRDYEKSLDCVLKAYQLSSKTNNKLLAINAVNKMGVQYHQLKIYEKSMQYLEQAEQMIKAYPYPDSIHRILGVNYLVKGFIYKEKAANGLAIDFFDKAVAEFKKVKSESVISVISITKYNKGNCYITLENDTLALQNFDEAFAYAKKIDAKSLEAFALKGKAKVYGYNNNYNLAIQTLKEAESYASGVTDLILNREIYKGLTENYLAVSDLNGYRIYNAKYLEVKNQIDANERQSISDSLDEKTQELKRNLENRVQNFYGLYALLFFTLLLLIFFLQLQSNKKQKAIDAKKTAIQLLLGHNKK